MFRLTLTGSDSSSASPPNCSYWLPNVFMHLLLVILRSPHTPHACSSSFTTVSENSELSVSIHRLVLFPTIFQQSLNSPPCDCLRDLGYCERCRKKWNYSNCNHFHYKLGSVRKATANVSSAALTASQHEGTFAHAVVIVYVLGTEVCSMDDQTALPARSATVAFQEQPETHHRAENKRERGAGRSERYKQ